MYLPLPPGGSLIELSPMPAQLSLFVDGTVTRGVQAGGAVLEDHAGQVVATTSWRFAEPTLDSTLAESNALEAALAWLEALQVRRPVVVYLDSYQALEHLQKRTRRYPALERLQARLADSSVVRMQNIERRRNRRADAAARAGLQAPRH